MLLEREQFILSLGSCTMQKCDAIYSTHIAETGKFLNMQNYIAHNLIVGYMTDNINQRK